MCGAILSQSVEIQPMKFEKFVRELYPVLDDLVGSQNWWKQPVVKIGLITIWKNWGGTGDEMLYDSRTKMVVAYKAVESCYLLTDE